MDELKATALEHLRPIVEGLGGTAIEVLAPRDPDSKNPFAQLDTLCFRLPPDVEVLVCYGESYPLTPPVVLVSIASGTTLGCHCAGIYSRTSREIH